ncbi:hypothetical protein, partial [Actinobacillus pleuropneumoniae]
VRIFGSFKPEHLRQMYHLPEPEKIYNKAFVEKFAAENEVQSEPIRDWRQNPAKHKHESSVSTPSILWLLPIAMRG